jgi:hypothetical protein
MRHTDVTNVQLRTETSSKLVTEIANSEGNVGEFELLLTLHMIYIFMINTLLSSSIVVVVVVVVEVV